ncbi:MAG: hypothetical protein ACRDUX_25380, partial [Mycobacterium sp.]
RQRCSRFHGDRMRRNPAKSNTEGYQQYAVFENLLYPSVFDDHRQQPLGQGLDRSSADRSIPPLKRGA